MNFNFQTNNRIFFCFFLFASFWCCHHDYYKQTVLFEFTHLKIIKMFSLLYSASIVIFSSIKIFLIVLFFSLEKKFFFRLSIKLFCSYAAWASEHIQLFFLDHNSIVKIKIVFCPFGSLKFQLIRYINCNWNSKHAPKSCTYETRSPEI